MPQNEQNICWAWALRGADPGLKREVYRRLVSLPIVLGVECFGAECALIGPEGGS